MYLFFLKARFEKYIFIYPYHFITNLYVTVELIILFYFYFFADLKLKFKIGKQFLVLLNIREQKYPITKFLKKAFRHWIILIACRHSFYSFLFSTTAIQRPIHFGELTRISNKTNYSERLTRKTKAKNIKPISIQYTI